MTDGCKQASAPINHCSFCAKSTGEVSMMIAGPLAMICNECVFLSVSVILDEGKKVALPIPAKAARHER